MRDFQIKIHVWIFAVIKPSQGLYADYFHIAKANEARPENNQSRTLLVSSLGISAFSDDPRASMCRTILGRTGRRQFAHLF